MLGALQEGEPKTDRAHSSNSLVANSNGFLVVIYIMLQLSLPVGFLSQAEAQHPRHTL